MARSMPSSSTSRWVTSRAVRGPSTETSTPRSRAAAPSAGRVQRGLAQVERHDVGAHRGRRPPRRTAPAPRPAGAARAWSSASRSMWWSQRVPPGRGEDAGLAHAAAQPLADHPGLRRSARRCRPPASRPARPGPWTGRPTACRTARRTSASGTPSATCACQIRAPSQCSATPASSATARSAAQRGQRDHRAAAPVVGLLDGDRPGRHRVVAVRADHRRDQRRGRASAPTAGQVRVEMPPIAAAAPISYVTTCASASQSSSLAGRHEQLQRDLVGHRAGRGEQRRLVPEQRGDLGLAAR